MKSIKDVYQINFLIIFQIVIFFFYINKLTEYKIFFY